MIAARRGGEATVQVPGVPRLLVRDRIASVIRSRGPRPRVALLAILAFAVLAVALSGATLGQAQSALLGDENSWIRIQNVGSGPAAVEIEYYSPTGQRVATESCPRAGACEAVRPGLGRSFFQQTNTDLQRGYRGSAYVTADQPFTALLARDVIRPDGTFQIAGDSLRLGLGTATHYLPWVVNHAQFVSRIVIENTSDEHYACAQIAFYAEGQAAAVAQSPQQGGSGCPNGGEQIPPRGTMIRDESNFDAPFGFNGSAIVRAQTTGAGTQASAQQLAVIVDTRERSGPGLSSYRSISDDEVANVVLLPVVDRNSTEGQTSFTTRFRIMSATPGVPTEVDLRYAGVDGNGNQVEIEHRITVNGARTCDQRFSGTQGCLAADQPLPNSFSGTVRMQSVQPIAVVAQRVASDGGGDHYRGFTADDASTQVVLPVLNKNYGPWGGNQGWNSWFRVQTFDGSVANVYVIYYSPAFPDGLFPPRSERIDGQRTFRQWENRQLPDGWVGTGVVVSDRPVVVVANLESDVFRGDPIMLYNGVPLE
jgi:hypothetical protein